MCVLISSTILYKTFLILRRIQRDVIINVCRSSCKVSVILVRLIKLEFFSIIFRKNSPILNFIEIRPEGAQLFHANGQTQGQRDRWTNTTKLIIVFAVLRMHLTAGQLCCIQKQSLCVVRYVNLSCGQNVTLLNVTPGGTYNL